MAQALGASQNQGQVVPCIITVVVVVGVCKSVRRFTEITEITMKSPEINRKSPVYC